MCRSRNVFVFHLCEKLRLPEWPAPARSRQTVANLVEVNRRQIVAGVSGGVMVDTADARPPSAAASADALSSDRGKAPPANADSAIWWWDAE